MQDKFFCLGHPAGFRHLFIGRLFISPTEVFPDGTGEQDVFLQNHGNLISQGLQVIIPDVHTAYFYDSFRCVIQAGNQLNQRGFGRSGASDDADGFPGTDMHLNIRKSHPFGFRGIFETNVFKVHGTVPDSVNRLFRIGQGTFFLKSFRNSLCRFLRYGDRHKYHGKHHQTVENHEAVVEHGRKLSHIQCKTF